MRELAATLGLKPLLVVYQNRNRPHPGMFLGRGKLEALKGQLDEWRAGIRPREWERRGAYWVQNAQLEAEERGDAEDEEEEEGPTAWGGRAWPRRDPTPGDALEPGQEDLLMVLDEDVRPGVLFNLEERLGVEAWDRTRLILEIFSEHANLKEARLQVELAKLQYEVPLVQEAIHRKMGRERPGFMGGGEYAVADYRDFIKRRMRAIRDELVQVRHDRAVRRKVRRGRFYQVALAGYTNAGKSSLLAALTGAETLRESALFTTLSTLTRRLGPVTTDRAASGSAGEPAADAGAEGARGARSVERADQEGPLSSYARPVLLTDTVGFIRALPSWLLDAFHATLEEIALSDVVLLVADASDAPDLLVEKVRVSQEELAHLDVTCPVVVVLNKVDRLAAGELSHRVDALVAEAEIRPESIQATSAATGRGLVALVAKIQGELPPLVRYRLTAPASEAGTRLLSRLYGWGSVEHVDYGQPLTVTGACDPLHWKALQRECRDAASRLRRIG